MGRVTLSLSRMPMRMFVRSFVHYTATSWKECPQCNPSGAPTRRSNLDGQDKNFCHPPPRHGWSIPRFVWMCTELQSGSAKRNLLHKIDVIVIAASPYRTTIQFPDRGSRLFVLSFDISFIRLFFRFVYSSIRSFR